MSDDAAVTKTLIATLNDGRDGFAKGAEKLEETNPEHARTFREYSDQRAAFAAELEQLARDDGDDVVESGTVVGAIHRGWMSLKDALAGSGPEGVLDVAEQGEDHAIGKYDEALGADISPSLRSVLDRQASEVRAAHDRVRSLRDAAA